VIRITGAVTPARRSASKTSLPDTLIIVKATFEHADLAFLCNRYLADTIQHARDVPLTLTTKGVR
jgi:hypothetical protein